MELLTPDGWSPATAINSLVMSIRAMLLAGDARLLTSDPKAKEARRLSHSCARAATRRNSGCQRAQVDYAYREAQKDFAHIVKVHRKSGWTDHKLFKNA